MSEDCNGFDEAGTSRCASCGIAENDEVKLKNCNGCYLVKYCGVKCQKTHRKQHKKECKKRAAELRDELLFKQPESTYLGDCPICCLPLPFDNTKLMWCCSKLVCAGCIVANMHEERGILQHTCPFCRKPMPETMEEIGERNMKRVEVNDPVAIYHEGNKQSCKGNHKQAFECFTRAAALVDSGAHAKLADMYRLGLGIEKDLEKFLQHLEEASIGGHPTARYALGVYEFNNLNIERAVKHWIIAAKQEDDEAIEQLMKMFSVGCVEKDVLAATLRAHKAAVDATKSLQREEAREFFETEG